MSSTRRAVRGDPQVDLLPPGGAFAMERLAGGGPIAAACPPRGGLAVRGRGASLTVAAADAPLLRVSGMCACINIPKYVCRINPC